MNRFLGLALAPLMVMSALALPTGVAAAEQGDRHGSLFNRYNFPSATRGDRFARRGLNFKTGVHGWRRFGKTIKKVASEQKIDPYVLGAYVWVESDFDPRQDYADGDKRALGLGSVQATDHPTVAPDDLQDPYTNLTITAREFRHKWHPHDMAGTVMDVWYPNWRKRVAHGEHLPVVKSPEVYVQAIANRYYALKEIDNHFRMR